MKFTKKCNRTQNKINHIKYKRDSSAGMFYTSSAGAVTSLILMLALPFLFSLSGTANTYATTSTLTISVVDSVSLNILPNGTTGTFATSDTSTNNISVRTTNGTGYTLGIKASTEGSNALNGANSTSIPSHTVSAGISEATYSTDSTYNNTWGYRPSKLNSTANSNYLPGPTSASSPIELDKTTSANPSTANNYNLAIGVRVDGNTAAGAYSNTFILTVVANPSIYSITYNKNTTDTVSGMPDNVVNQETSSETVTLANNTPTRTGYTFQDWCTVQVADGAACTGTSYSPGSTWTIDQTASTNSLALYARWKIARTYIQDFTKANCQSLASDANYTVYDRRDEGDYTVKYIYNACWMTQNLRITGTVSAQYSNFTGNNFNISAGSLTSGSSYTQARSAYNNNTTYGAYYNYCAASAGTVCTDSKKKDATSDICPSNWRLPNQSELNAIANDSASQWEVVKAGWYYNGTLTAVGNGGTWWSSTAYSTYQQYIFNYNLFGATVSFATRGDNGDTIRCVRSS